MGQFSLCAFPILIHVHAKLVRVWNTSQRVLEAGVSAGGMAVGVVLWID